MFLFQFINFYSSIFLHCFLQGKVSFYLKTKLFLVDIEKKCLNDCFYPSSEVKNFVKQYIKASIDYNGFDNRVYGGRMWEKSSQNCIMVNMIWYMKLRSIYLIFNQSNAKSNCLDRFVGRPGNYDRSLFDKRQEEVSQP